MPRVSREESDNHRLAITEASARLFREHGLKGVSVSDLMAAAGLTHGGFYGHFESKDALAAEACAMAFRQSATTWRKRVASHTDAAQARAAIIDGYLSARTRDNPGTSCAMPALAVDVAREPADAPIRASFAAGIEELAAILQSVQATGAAPSDRRAALLELATMVGAVVLARATEGTGASEELLAAAREGLLPPAAAPTPKRPVSRPARS
jgi:TetR/AcrR family transcriptional repressor of nem operon